MKEKMTIVTLLLTKQTETFYFNPPLPPAKEVQLISFAHVIGISKKFFCNIVDSFSHYSNLERDESEPTQLIAYIGCYSIPMGKKFGVHQSKIVCPEKFQRSKCKKVKTRSTA